MARKSLGGKLEQQYEQIKGGLKNVAQKVTEEDTEPRTDAMAGRRSGARTVGKTRSTARAASATKEQLYADAKRLGVKGRSKMTKDQLAKAVRGR
jgi:hypothetical protein